MVDTFFSKQFRIIYISTCFLDKIRLNSSQLQGVPTRYDILWSPRWPTKVDFQVQKKVAAHSGDGDIWVLSIFFQKSNIGWPQQPLTSKLQDTSKNLDFWWSNPQKGISIGHFGARGDAIIKIRQFFEEKGIWRSLRSLRLLGLPRSMRL